MKIILASRIKIFRKKILVRQFMLNIFLFFPFLKHKKKIDVFYSLGLFGLIQLTKKKSN